MALQDAFGLPVKPEVPLFGHVGRLVEQKGLDLIMELVPQLVQRRLQLVFLGTGQPQLEQALRQAHERHPTKFGVRIAYDEQLAHLIEAGSDAFLMPSRLPMLQDRRFCRLLGRRRRLDCHRLSVQM